MLTRLGLHTGLGQSFRLSVKNGFPSAETAGFAIRQRSVTSLARGVHTSQAGRQAKPSHSVLLFVAGTASIFAYSLNAKPLLCQPANQSARPYAEPHTVSVQGPGSAKLTRSNDLPPVESAVDLKSLSFGAVAGISTGIFVKKGLKAVGFLLGGAFVFLQVSRRTDFASTLKRSLADRNTNFYSI
jgi:hypothetical protein